MGMLNERTADFHTVDYKMVINISILLSNIDIRQVYIIRGFKVWQIT